MNVALQPTSAAPLPPQVQGIAQGPIQPNVQNNFGRAAESGTNLAGALAKSAFEVMPQVQAAREAQRQQAAAQRSVAEAQKAASDAQGVAYEANQAKALKPLEDALDDASHVTPSNESFGPVERDLDVARRIQKTIDAAVESGVRSDHPKIQAARQTMYQSLISAQMKAQSMGLSLEAASKVVESATSGVRTVLQTQT